MNDSIFNAPLSRRDVVKRTVLFSTALLSPGIFRKALAQIQPVLPVAESLQLMAIGDFGTGKPGQIQVAGQMAEFAHKLSKPVNGVLALGDNFYGDPSAENFKKLFEEMYSRENLNCPFYACLGNHDYYGSKTLKKGREKAQAQLNYSAQNPDSRWKMPAKWYAIELPDAKNPLVKIIFTDTNYFEGALTKAEKLEQKLFVTKELKKKSLAPWLWMAGHHPYFSNGDHGDNKELIKLFGPHLKKHPISLHLSGHDHTLQHLQVEGYHPSFVVSGAGGQDLYKVKQNTRSPYSGRIFGFNYINVTREFFEVRYIGADGECLHAFRRTLDGKVAVI